MSKSAKMQIGAKNTSNLVIYFLLVHTTFFAPPGSYSSVIYTVSNIKAKTNLLVRLSNDFKDRINVCRFDLFSFFKVRMSVYDF